MFTYNYVFAYDENHSNSNQTLTMPDWRPKLYFENIVKKIILPVAMIAYLARSYSLRALWRI